MNIIKRLRIENANSSENLNALESLVAEKIESIADRYEGHDGMEVNDEGRLVIYWTQESRDLDAPTDMEPMIEEEFYSELSQELREQAPELF